MVLPAHQYLAAMELTTLAVNDGLQVGNELLLDDGALELLGRGGDMAPPAIGGKACQAAQSQDQDDDGALFFQREQQHGFQRESLIEAVAECRRTERVVEPPKHRGDTVVDPALDIEPLLTYLHPAVGPA